jgi:hypothetical protein
MAHTRENLRKALVNQRLRDLGVDLTQIDPRDVQDVTPVPLRVPCVNGGSVTLNRAARGYAPEERTEWWR